MSAPRLNVAEWLARRAALAEIQRRADDAANADRGRKCGARTRAGSPCRCKPEPGKARCKLHGGKSTGPKSAEGRARISAAQIARRRT